MSVELPDVHQYIITSELNSETISFDMLSKGVSKHDSISL